MPKEKPTANEKPIAETLDPSQFSEGKFESPGRPKKLTPVVVKNLLLAIEMGCSYKLACQYAGVSYNSFRSWVKKGEAQNKGEYRYFLNLLKKTEARGAVRNLMLIQKAAGDGNWQAAAWKLERRYPDEFGRTKVEVEHRHIEVTLPDEDDNEKGKPLPDGAEMTVTEPDAD